MAPKIAHGVIASMVTGLAAGAIAWLFAGLAPSFSSNYARLDQLEALAAGAVLGSAVLGTRAYRQRGDTVFAAIGGAVLGAVGALAGATPIAFARLASTPAGFLVERMLAWALMGTGTAALLSVLARPASGRHFIERVLIASIGGAIAGTLFTLPGPSELWQGIAFLWFGMTIGVAIAGPESWHAAAIIEGLPERGRRRNLFTLREWLIGEGDVVALGEAQVSCQHGRVALYPPAGGVVAAGHAVRQPKFVYATQTIAVGRARYRMYLVSAR